MELDDLDKTLEQLTPIVKKKLRLFLWEDQVKNMPVIRNIIIEFEHMAEVTAKGIIKAIDKVTPVSAIMVECAGCQEMYRVKKVEDFMKKPCEGC
jgi:hypothetical protein